MKKIASLAAALAIIGSIACAADSYTIAGSDILGQTLKEPLAALLEKRGIKTNIDMKGSFTALDALKKSQVDVAIIALPRGEKAPDEFITFPFAYLVATVAVNVANPIEEITTSQLYKIFSSSATPRVDTWQAMNVGNASLKNIMPVTTSFSDSIILELFKYGALKSTGIGKWVNIAKSPSEALSILRANNSAIAVLGKVEDRNMIKVLAIASDNDGGANKYAFRPDRDNNFNGDYPLALSFNIAVEKQKAAKLKPLLKALLDDETAALIDSGEYISAPKNSRKKSIFELDILK